MYQNQNQKSGQMTSIVEGDLRSAFLKILNFYDPNKSENKKTSILDTSVFCSWAESDRRLYFIEKTNNLNGSVKNKKFDVIIFEPTANKSYFANCIEYSKNFVNLLKPNGCVIVKTKDFKEEKEIRGSYQLRIIFESNDFIMTEQFIVSGKVSANIQKSKSNEIDINHTYFMIFRKKAIPSCA